MNSLKRIGLLAFIGVGLLLSLVIVLGFRQYQLTSQYSNVINQSEEVIFQFITIREQITESLIEGDFAKVSAAADGLKNLHSSLARLQENDIIPAEYKLDMAKQVNLSALAVSAKNSNNATDKLSHSLALQRAMRDLSNYLIQFDRIIVSQMKAKVVGFQTVMIGALGIIICLITFSLILLYKKTVLPLIILAAQTKESDIMSKGLQYGSDACSEVTELADSINTMLLQHTDQQQEPTDQKQSEKFATLINESTNLSNGIINYAQLLSDSLEDRQNSEEELQILKKIIAAGERIAKLMTKI